MSESELSQPDLQDVLPDADPAGESEEPVAEQTEFQSVEQATALLRSSWKFAAVVQFSRMFAAPLKLKVFAADILESALISPDNHRMFLSELLFKLLRADALQPYSENSEAWATLLYKKLSAKWPEHFQAHPLAGTTFYDTTPSTRIDILFALCDWRVHDCPAVKDVIKRTVEQIDGSVDALRQEPIGEDSKGNLYYYFSFNNEDCRLYRQEPLNRKPAKRRRSDEEETDWETVCTSVEEMAEFVDSLSAAKSGKDKLLHDLVSMDILPQLVESAAARRRAEEKQAAIEAMPKKRSSRLQELTSKKEEEDRLKAQQLADRLHRQRENERIRKEREREDRLLARQRDDERQMELQRRLAGVYPEAPSREERLQRRMKSSQAGSSSDSGGLPAEQSQLNSRSSARLAQQAQHAHQHSSPPPPSHHQEEQESHHPHRPHHNRQQQPQAQRPQEQEQQQRSPRQGPSRQHAQHAQHDNPDSTDQAESGLLTRLRPRSSRRRTWQETLAWSPLEVPVPQRRRTDLDLRPRKNMAGLVAAAQGLSHAYGRNRRGKWVLYDQVEESTGQPAKAAGRTGGRASRAANLSSAGPSSPAASRDSGAGKQGPVANLYAASSQRYLDTGSSYTQQQHQQWMQPQQSGYAAPSASHSNSWSQQAPQQRQQLHQQQLNSQQMAKSELQSLVQQLTPQQREHLSKMPHDKRMQFFHNLRSQMARAQQQQQQSQQQQQQQLQQQKQQMSQQGSWQQQPSGLQQTGSGLMHQPGLASQTQGLSQQQQYQQQLQQLTLSRLSPHQMQQLQDLPVEQRAMHFGQYMRQTQLQLQQHQMQQQQQQQQNQYPPQGMPTYQPGMVPTTQASAGMSSQSHMASQAHMGPSMQQHGSGQQMRAGGMQQPSYPPTMYAQQAASMRQQPSSYPGMAQAYPGSTAEQSSPPTSPPGLPRGPPQSAAAPQRSQIKSASGAFLGPQMIRPATATTPMMAHQMANQMAGSRMAGSQMVGHHMLTSQLAGSQMTGNHRAGNMASLSNSASAFPSASLPAAAAPSSSALMLGAPQGQGGPQPSHSASSRPNSARSRPGSASSQEGGQGSGQSHGAPMPQGRAAAGQADAPAPASQGTMGYPSGMEGVQMQQGGYGGSAHGKSWQGSMQGGMGAYPTSSSSGQKPGLVHGGARQQGFTAATQAAMLRPMQASSSHLSQTTSSAQAPLPLHFQSISQPALLPSTGLPPSAPPPPTSATHQAPSASQAPKPDPQGMTQQAEGPAARDPAMAVPSGQPASTHGPASEQHFTAHAATGDSMKHSLYSSVPRSGSSGGAGGGAVYMNMLNGVRPMHPSEATVSAASLGTSQAHKTSNGNLAVKSRSSSPAVAQSERPQPTQGSPAATVAPAGFAATAATETQQGDLGSGAVTVPSQVQSHETAAASVSHEAADAERGGATSSVVPVQSGLAKGIASKDSDMEEASELIESQMLTSGQSMSQNLLAD